MQIKLKKRIKECFQSIFLINNSPSRSHKIIKLLGIKISVKTPNSNEKRVQKVRARYIKHIKKLQQDINRRKIRVLFYVTENQKWCYQSVYDELVKGGKFEPFIVVGLLTSVHNGADTTRNTLEENYQFFKNRNMKVEYGYRDNEYINLESFNPDIVFYEQQWGLPQSHHPSNVSKFALTYYLPYGFSTLNFKCDYTQEFHRFLHKYFVSSQFNIDRFELYHEGNSLNCCEVSYPKLDTYLDSTTIDLSKYWKSPDRIKIIYAPHHSFEQNGIRMATFKENGKFILELAKKSQNTTWIFKPHPRFKFALLKDNIMTEEEVEQYYNDWNTVGNIYTQGDYLDIFKSSDLMITDCCSFLAEYLPTGKPLIRLINHDSISLNSVGEEIVKGYYQVDNLQDLNNIYNQIVYEGKDSKKFKRIESQKYIIDFSQPGYKKIVQEIINELTRGK